MNEYLGRISAIMVLAGFAPACYTRDHMGDWPHMMDYWYGGGLMMVVFWVIVLALVGVAVYYFVQVQKKAPPSEGGQTKEEDPINILKTRYAKGEITKQEFEDMKKDLE